MTKPYFIYGLVDPRDGRIHYIGRASSKKRPMEHMRPAKLALDFTPKARWIRALVATGASYSVKVLEDAPSASALNDAETWWIAHGRTHAWPLTNQTAGGDGMLEATPELRERMRRNSTGRKHRPESKEKMRQAKLGKPRTPDVIAKLKAMRPTEEQREKMRAAKRGKPWTPAMRAARADIVVSSETRAKMSAAMKGRTFSDESRAKMSAAKRGKPRPDLAERNRGAEQRAAVSAAFKGRTRDGQGGAWL